MRRLRWYEDQGRTWSQPCMCHTRMDLFNDRTQQGLYRKDRDKGSHRHSFLTYLMSVAVADLKYILVIQILHSNHNWTQIIIILQYLIKEYSVQTIRPQYMYLLQNALHLEPKWNFSGIKVQNLPLFSCIAHVGFCKCFLVPFTSFPSVSTHQK